MKPFHTVTIPHKDILEGRLTMDVFAADLWEVHNNRGPDEYREANKFIEQTYFTEGLENLLGVVEKRLKGAGGDPVIQVQTPFGGGKTHALIAMYHKATEWEAKRVVIDGTALSKDETFWGQIELQLTGKKSDFNDMVAPGKEALRALLEKNQPVLILMDEILEYATKAAGVRIGDSTLAAQTIAFMHEITRTVNTLEKVCLVITLPSSVLEHYDESAERLYQQLQKVTGSVEKIFTPVQDSEITHIIRRRLFSSVNKAGVDSIVKSFMDYADKEGILPAGTQPSEYRDKFTISYPFMPEIIEVLYHRWGSYHTFQRTRGVLRLLSLVIHSMKGMEKSYISLADFDLGMQEIRQELLKHIGPEFNSVIAADITDWGSGAQKVDQKLGDAYQGLGLGVRTATTIFMYSFSGGLERGITAGEIKRSATTIENPSSVVSEAADLLRNKLFYLQSDGEKYYFSNQPNLNRLVLTRMENIKDEQAEEEELDLLKKGIRGDKLKVYLWEERSSNITDDEALKLVILKNKDDSVISSIGTTKGETPRVNRNTVFFLWPVETEKTGLLTIIKRKMAFEKIQTNSGATLSEGQTQNVKKELRKIDSSLGDHIRRVYRIIGIPQKEGIKEMDMGIPTFGEEKSLDQDVYEVLRSNGEILEKIAPLVIKEKYLRTNDHVPTYLLYHSSLKTPGETRPVRQSVIEQGIVEGVNLGLFGLGELENGKPVLRCFKDTPTLGFSETEILIKEEICKELIEREGDSPAPPTPPTPIPPGGGEPPEVPGERGDDAALMDSISLRFNIPRGRVHDIMGILNLLQSKFEEIEIEINANEGGISEQDYEDKIEETFRQLGINVKK